MQLYSAAGGGPKVVVSTAAFHAGVRDSFPGLGGLKKRKCFFPHQLVKLSIVDSYHHPQEGILAQFSLYVHKSGLKPDLFHFQCCKTVKTCDE